jgi:hypothetical protein
MRLVAVGACRRLKVRTELADAMSAKTVGGGLTRYHFEETLYVMGSESGSNSVEPTLSTYLPFNTQQQTRGQPNRVLAHSATL